MVAESEAAVRWALGELIHWPAAKHLGRDPRSAATAWKSTARRVAKRKGTGKGRTYKRQRAISPIGCLGIDMLAGMGMSCVSCALAACGQGSSDLDRESENCVGFGMLGCDGLGMHGFTVSPSLENGSKPPISASLV